MRVHSANGTFADAELSFGALFPSKPPYAESPQYRNMTITFNSAGNKTSLHGRATFYLKLGWCMSLTWYAPSNAQKPLAVLDDGPSPPPPPIRGHCTVYKTVNATGAASIPGTVSGGPAIQPDAGQLYPSWPGMCSSTTASMSTSAGAGALAY